MGKNSKDDSLSRFEELIKISVRYNDYLTRPRLYHGFSSIRTPRKNDVAQYVTTVNKTLEKLSNEDKYIINNEFFSINKDPLWWTKYYSKSTYYRKRYFAVKAFMEIYAQ